MNLFRRIFLIEFDPTPEKQSLFKLLWKGIVKIIKKIVAIFYEK